MFEASLESMMLGEPVGLAMRHFNHRALALADRYLSRDPHAPGQDELWLAYRDARNYVIMGDSAVRLGTP